MTTFGSDLILARLQQLHPKSIDLSLDRLAGLLERLGHPERRLPPVVHIAGTNGKGSTLAMLDAMLSASGSRTQRYVSPHLVRFNERILLEGRPIDEADLAEILDICERLNNDAPITFFEITTAAAFLAFERHSGDALLLETGLGGRLDATNVIDRPALTILTPISMDHESYLGTSLGSIAGEKAGILKSGVRCIVGPQQPEALAAIVARADEVGAPLVLHGRDWQAVRANDRLIVDFDGECLDLPLPVLVGSHQIDNAGAAAVAARTFGKRRPSMTAIAAGLRQTYWPARLQRLTTGPLADMLPAGAELWLDGGHNPAAAAALAASMREFGDRPLHLIVGMLTTKDLSAFLTPLAPLAHSLHAVAVPDEASSHDPAQGAALARKLGIDARAAASVGDAIKAVVASAASDARILICGSLYLAGHILRENS